jgi:two-component system, LytTR family, response regulator
VLRLLLIEDSECKEELDRFIKDFKQSIRSDLEIGSFINHQRNKLLIDTTTGVRLLNINDIMYCELLTKHTFRIFTKKGSFMVRESLKTFNALFHPDLFVRVHHSFLVNIQHVEVFTRASSLVTLCNNAKVPVSARRKKWLIEKLRQL